MKSDNEVEVERALLFMVVVFIGAFLAMGYKEHEKSTCKQLAINHNMSSLEIKGLCQ